METTKKIEAVIYARVSSKEQEESGYSLEAQEKLLKDYAEQRGFELVKIYKVTESASGKQIRKMFIEMIQYVTMNDINIILCEKIDRLTRNLKDAATASDWILESDGREIHFVKENFVVSKNTRAHENFVWDMKVAMARFYTNNLSEEVKKGQKEKTSQGWLPTKPPLGYKTIGEKGHKIHIIDEKVAPYIKEMFTLYATGNYSTISLGKKMYELGFRSRGGNRVVKSKTHKLLCDPFYYGKFMWKGKLYDGRHEPIISKDLFDQVKEKLTRLSAPYHNKHAKELRGKVVCGNCKKTVTWELQKGHWYGGCKQCKTQLGSEKKYIRQEVLETDLLAHLGSIAPKNGLVLEVLKKALKESHNEESALHEAQVNGINASLLRIQQRMKTMYDDKLDGRISAEFYDEKVTTFGQERETLSDALKKLNSDSTEYYKVGYAIHELALKASDIYKSEKATIEERRLLLAYSFSNISVLKGEVIPEYTKAFNFLSTWMPKVNKILEPIQKTAETIISSGDLYSLTNHLVVGLSESRDNSRTSRKPSVKARQRHLLPLSRPLLRG
jgi:DNA invertase Pin-like site-specific DNA recombinase